MKIFRETVVDKALRKFSKTEITGADLKLCMLRCTCTTPGARAPALQVFSIQTPQPHHTDQRSQLTRHLCRPAPQPSSSPPRASPSSRSPCSASTRKVCSNSSASASAALLDLQHHSLRHCLVYAEAVHPQLPLCLAPSSAAARPPTSRCTAPKPCTSTLRCRSFPLWTSSSDSGLG